MSMLLRGKTIEMIKDTLHVSNSAVLGVSSWIKNPSSENKELIRELNSQKNWELLTDKIEEIIASLPMPKYRNWKLIAKDRLLDSKKRNVRRQLS